MLLLVLAIAGFDRDLLALRRPRVVAARRSGSRAAVFVGSFIVIELLEQVLHGGEEQGLTPDGWQPEHAGAYAANFVVIAVVAPIVEELTFRGLGYSLLEPFGPWIAIVVVGRRLRAAATVSSRACPSSCSSAARSRGCGRRRTASTPGSSLHALFNAIALDCGRRSS